MKTFSFFTVIAFTLLISSCGTAPHRQRDPSPETIEYFRSGGEFDLFIGNLASEGRFSGTIAVALDQHLLYEAAYGIRDREHNLPMQTDTTLNVASIGKSFTAIAIAQLVQSGKLSYNDLVETYLPQFAELSRGQITIEYLLTHRSGLGDFRSNPNYIRDMNQLIHIQENLPYILSEDLQFQPGERSLYSNSGYMVLGAIIEVVSGIDFYDYIQAHIFDPAGMTNSGFYSKFEDIPNRAWGYFINPQGILTNNITNHPYRGSSAGGSYSSAEDIIRFMQGFNTDLFLKNTQAEMFPYPNAPQSGFGMQRRQVAGHTVISMSGGSPGVRSTYETYPELGYHIAVLTNSDDGFNTVMEELRRFLFGVIPGEQPMQMLRQTP